MKSLRVTQGIWKGKELPSPKEVAGHSHFTNSLIKKAVFSLLQSKLQSSGLSFTSSLFVDFFAGSGQMSAEAYSLGFFRILTYELNQDRFFTLMQIFKHCPNVRLFRKDATKHVLKWDLEAEEALFFYIDPPYTYWSETPIRMKQMLNDLYHFCEASEKLYCILSQIPEHQKTETIFGGLPYKVREYGSHFLIEISNSNLEEE